MPLFSVIVPTYNRRDLLPATLDSVFAQTHTASEIIVVDDGSDDGTVGYVASLGGRVRLLQQQHSGPGAARNLGAASASGDYLVFIDSDDLWLPWTLAIFAEIVNGYARPSLICGRFIEFVREAELSGLARKPTSAAAFADYLASWPRYPIVGAGMIAVRRHVFLDAGGFEQRAINMEDHELSLKLGTSPGFVQITEPVTLGWRRHPGGVTNDLDRSLAGCFTLIAREQEGRYPGGVARAWQRRNVIAGHARSLSLECVKRGRVREALRIYCATWRWHLALGRARYILAFPFYALIAIVRRRRQSHPS